MINFGWEYLWHCHLLGHEENDMMRTMAVAVAPNNSTNLRAVLQQSPLAAVLNWTDSSVSETGFYVLRSTNLTGPFTPIASIQSTTGPQKGANITYNDTTLASNTSYFYEVLNANLVGDNATYASGGGYPTVEAEFDTVECCNLQLTVTTGY